MSLGCCLTWVNGIRLQEILAQLSFSVLFELIPGTHSSNVKLAVTTWQSTVKLLECQCLSCFSHAFFRYLLYLPITSINVPLTLISNDNGSLLKPFLYSVKLGHQIAVSIVELAYQISSVVNLTQREAGWDWPISINPF